MTSSPTIDPAESAFFGKLAADWWDPRGSSAMLHRLNPARLSYLRARIDEAWDTDPRARHPLAGKTALDAGCGAGLLSEPLARLGATVTGLDAAAENIAVARLHAEGQGLAIDYRVGEVGQLVGERFDLIVSMEVIEHVADPSAFIATLAGLLAEGGLLILSTPNRTPLSKLALITVGEGFGMIPKGTHDHTKFLAPDELAALAESAGLEVIDTTGLSFDPRTGFVLSSNLALDYFITARRGPRNF
ncbi:MAG TPA: bifunctional 2-polyprenyl-6-hydroxyphenol methylase/3-demethylubiquinol 3-O-methyltransferase UbiG [Sphingomonas sp.]|nr:bifunctional 2-polyprenyl-6-hydroxyphenol methylase/3-demethylubiquinol 3-O-methyltransferase UbiG [Sphingomonas sp.]